MLLPSLPFPYRDKGRSKNTIGLESRVKSRRFKMLHGAEVRDISVWPDIDAHQDLSDLPTIGSGRWTKRIVLYSGRPIIRHPSQATLIVVVRS